MIPIVNDRYKYILLYSAKSGSTSSRLLYLLLHGDEFTQVQGNSLIEYHNLNQLHMYDVAADYTDYTKFLITRNPYSRAVSAFLDQYVYAQNERVTQMLTEYPPRRASPDNFIEFLEYLKSVPDQERDTHFQTQACFAFTHNVITKRNWLARKFVKLNSLETLELDFFSDITNFSEFTRKVYACIFKSQPSMISRVEEELSKINKSNSSFYGEIDYDDAAVLSVAELDALTLSPKPQDFYHSERAQRLVEEVYAEDFRLFGYKLGRLPHKPASVEVDYIPADFDWQAYIKFNSDLAPSGVRNERTAVRHFLEFGRFERRAYKRSLPNGFDWQHYLALHDDLRAAGINTQQAAVMHYLSYGIREERPF